MSTSVDIHAKLASIIERFAKCALVEMTKIIDNDSALLRAEISRRQMEIESLLCKLQFAESELRSARQAAIRQPPNLRSVGIQVSNASTLRDNYKDRQGDTLVENSPAQSFSTKDGVQPLHVKEETTEMKTGDCGEDFMSVTLSCSSDQEVEENQGWEDEQDSPHTPGEGCEDLASEVKPGVIWDSPEPSEFSLRKAQGRGASQEAPNTSRGQRGRNAAQIPAANTQLGLGHFSDTAGAGHRVAAPAPEQGSDGPGTGEKSSRCGQCGKTFTTRFYLKIHQRIHTGERPYTCLQCGKRFYCNSHLISHQRCHTGEKPYSCEECGKSYSHLNSLKLHQRSHTEEETYGYW
ncbi:uncharacterized protein LOC143493203 isoform X2 [Brachyhypopomus gauderio]|uniref:uncharacterized protein LOC143493203 isoform X2 n=1 Tax=Brachyhypopomus gauderio TaxID=698409 RepID=UPI00404230AA